MSRCFRGQRWAQRLKRLLVNTQRAIAARPASTTTYLILIDSLIPLQTTTIRTYYNFFALYFSLLYTKYYIHILYNFNT